MKAQIPLLVGVTGHRNLRPEDDSMLRTKVRMIFEHLTCKYPKVQLALLSPLAEGADTLVAEVALELGIQLIVPLPLPLDLYAKDFSNQTIDVFKKLLVNATFSFEIPFQQGANRINAATAGPERSEQYLAAGHFIVQHAQVMITIWDGIDNGKKGGTANIVQLMLEGDDGDICDEQIQPGCVFHLKAQRAINVSSLSGAKTALERYKVIEDIVPGVDLLCQLSTDGLSLHDVQFGIISNIQRYNIDIAELSKFSREYEKKRICSINYLFPEGEGSLLLESGQKTVLENYSHADTLAQHFQKETFEVIYLLACLVPFIVFFFETYSNVTTSPGIVAAYLGCITVANVVFYLARQRKLDDKHLDYRALAEGLRIQFFWRLTGLSENPAAYYLNKQQSELDWIRYALRTINLISFRGMPPVSSPETLQAVRSYWIENQSAYFVKSARQQKEQGQQLDLLATWIFRLGMFVVIPVMLLVHGLKLGSGLLDSWLQVATPCCFILAGAIKFYTDRRLFSEHAKQYVRMFNIFSKASKQLNTIPVDNSDEYQSIILKLGKESLSENGDWVLMHRERPIEVPQG
jgi:hypothetical protein